MTNLAEGTVIDDRFELLEHLGSGGMGEVWLARDQDSQQQVALKFLRDDLTNQPGMADLLRRELRNTRALTHPFIVRAYEMHVSSDGRHYLSMAPVIGETMADLVGKDAQDFVPALMGVADALNYAHVKGIVHRDLKLSNVLLDASGKPHVCDFGIAGLLVEGQHAAHLSTPGSTYGASPQQLTGEAPQPSDDVYALGAMLYELLNGRPPFFPRPVREHILTQAPEPLAAEHPEPLRRLAMQMLAKQPADRPAGMAAVKRALADALKEMGAHTPPPEMTDGSAGELEFESIAPVELKPTTQSARGRDGRRQIPASVAMAAVAIMVIALILTVVFLPGWVEQRQASKPAVTSAQPQPPAAQPASTGSAPAAAPTSAAETVPELSPYELALQKQQRERAESILDEFVNYQMQLEEKNIDSWAKEDLSAAKRQAIAGDELFRKQQFIAAGEAYAQGVTMLQTLAQRAIDEVSAGIEAGQAALNDGNQPVAQRSFEAVLVIEPDNSAAAAGLERAGKLDEVLALMQSGRDAEANGDLVTARDAYSDVRKLDAAWEPAVGALSRVRSRIAQGQFAATMSEGFAALENGDTQTAKAAFEQASQLRPGSSDPQEGLAQVELMQRDLRIADHRKQAMENEQAEQWQLALDAYEKALALDDTLIFAKQGKDRVKDKAIVATQLETLLNQPERLSSQRVLQSARTLIADAQALSGTGKRIVDQTNTLSQLVQLYDTPVTVNLLSDNICEVVVYRVGRLGTFESKALSLRPGQYTAVGTRAGFRDVRKEFKVPAGGPPASVELRCEEPI